jgi:hypothetical protein
MNMSMRKKMYLILASAILIHSLFIFAKNKPADISSTVVATTTVAATTVASTTVETSETVATEEESDKSAKSSSNLYTDLNLDNLGLTREAFDYALAGYNLLNAQGKIKNKKVLSIVDFSKPSSKKRLFVIDMNNGKLLFNTYVSHGRNSGREIANQFSNEAESNKSSLGFYVTGDTYMGKHGYSLRLLGEERGINDNANSRAIVMHSAAYVSEAAIRMQGFIGRSLGCPALPEGLNRPIIEKIKNGSCLFLYSPDKNYASHSTILRKVA